VAPRPATHFDVIHLLGSCTPSILLGDEGTRSRDAPHALRMAPKKSRPAGCGGVRKAGVVGTLPLVAISRVRRRAWNHQVFRGWNRQSRGGAWRYGKSIRPQAYATWRNSELGLVHEMLPAREKGRERAPPKALWPDTCLLFLEGS
jgi:hypothetical protein